ncbi:hypothetical protein GO986_08650 [Deinococcus sp. HMF7620]|uniref:Uncharacterized protein n=1 Tax=Deinococcus arboris TaxID=2682977 RepID=A0A7C9I2U8_9DEIO|nr:hypothetical protein [Deinococcus arboris]MVN86831.1 hypothetical protein [Deinococcus arboris]
MTLAFALSTVAAAQNQPIPMPTLPPPTAAQKAKANTLAKNFTGRICQDEGLEFREFKPQEYMNKSLDKERVMVNQMVDAFVKQFKMSGLKVVKDTKTPSGRYLYMQGGGLALITIYDIRKEGGTSLQCVLK